MPFTFRPAGLPGLILIEPRVLSDDRGFFLETYKESDFVKGGITARFVQDNHSRSARGVLRGLHFQNPPHGQGKLVRVTAGAAWDVAVDLRRASSCYRQWVGLELSAGNRLMLYIPDGFAHGFVALTDGTELQYKCTAEYNAASESGIRWDDPAVGIRWPIADVSVSARDAALPRLGQTE